MTEADVMFMARDCSHEILKQFTAPPFDQEDVGTLVFGELKGLFSVPNGGGLPVTIAGTNDREAFRRQIQEYIETTIRNAIVRHAADIVKEWGKP